MSQKYETPAAFKQALDQRLKTATPAGVPVARTRQLAVFDRFLARIGVVFGDAATLKGGVALELRLERARTTKDIDLRLMGTTEGLLDRLQEAGRLVRRRTVRKWGTERLGQAIAAKLEARADQTPRKSAAARERRRLRRGSKRRNAKAI